MRRLAYEMKKKAKKKKPPITFRYCEDCEKERPFTYNWRLKHSQCSVCGGRRARRKQNGI